MDVFDMVEEWLKENGYDGLYNAEGECACMLGGLQPCGENFADCKPGYKVKWEDMTPEQRGGMDDDMDFYIVDKKK